MELTKNETEIMNVLWKEGRPLTSVQIVEKSKDKTWKSSSIHILLNSLLKKEAIKEVGFVRSGKGYARTFEPTISSEQYYTDIFAEIADKASISSFFMALFNSKKISKETIEELESLIESKKKELD